MREDPFALFVSRPGTKGEKRRRRSGLKSMMDYTAPGSRSREGWERISRSRNCDTWVYRSISPVGHLGIKVEVSQERGCMNWTVLIVQL